MKYQILTGLDVDQLEERVREALADEWVPTGGPFVYRNELYQAMTQGQRWEMEVKEHATLGDLHFLRMVA